MHEVLAWWKGQTFVGATATGAHAPGAPVRGLSDDDLPPAIYVAKIYLICFQTLHLVVVPCHAWFFRTMHACFRVAIHSPEGLSSRVLRVRLKILKAKKEELERLQAEARAHEEEVKKQIADVKEFEKHQAQLALETERQKAIQEESTVKKDAAQKMKAAKQRELEAKRLEFEKLKKEAEDAEEAARLEEEKAIKETERLNEEREKQKVLERVRHAYEEEEKEKKRLAQQEADRLAAQDAARLEEERLAKEALDAQNAAMKKAEEEKKQAEALLAKQRREQGERERAETGKSKVGKRKRKGTVPEGAACQERQDSPRLASRVWES